MRTLTEHGDATGRSRRLVRSELDLLSLGITSLLADVPCHYSPLVLTGAAAVTTLLLRDIRQHWQRLHHDRLDGQRILMIDPGRLARDLDAAAGDGLDSVHRRWTSADLVLIDGIALLKEEHQFAALPHLLDRINEAGSRIVCSLPHDPKSPCELPEPLASRLGAGLVVTVRDTAARAAAVEPPAGSPQPTIRRILSATARHYGLVPDDLVGSSRRRTVALARGVAMHLVRQLCGESLATIGRRFSGRDHTTVMHAIRVTQERIEQDPGLAQDCEAILAALGPRPVRRRS